MNMNNQSDIRPQEVRTARALIYTTLGMEAIRFPFLLYCIGSELPGPIILASILAFFVTFGLTAWLTAMIIRRKNWARITFLVLYLISLLPFARSLGRSFPITPISGILGLVQVAFQGYAMILLFRQEAADWFRNKTITSAQQEMAAQPINSPSPGEETEVLVQSHNVEPAPPAPAFSTTAPVCSTSLKPDVSAKTADCPKCGHQFVYASGFKYAYGINFKDPLHRTGLALYAILIAGLAYYIYSVTFPHSDVDPQKTEEIKHFDESVRKAREAAEGMDAAMHPK